MAKARGVLKAIELAVEQRDWAMRVLVVDNYDSFAYNLVQYLGELGAEVEVFRNDQADPDRLIERAYDRAVVSPGPCTPDDAGISLAVTRRFPRPACPRWACAWATRRWPRPSAPPSCATSRCTARRPRSSTTAARSSPGCPGPLTVGRYHSLVVDAESLPDVLEPTASGGGVLMGVRHRRLPAEGVQFHPESVLTDAGKQLLENFLAQPDAH